MELQWDVLGITYGVEVGDDVHHDPGDYWQPPALDFDLLSAWIGHQDVPERLLDAFSDRYGDTIADLVLDALSEEPGHCLDT